MITFCKNAVILSSTIAYIVTMIAICWAFIEEIKEIAQYIVEEGCFSIAEDILEIIESEE